jgi:hypothetical protein
LQLRDLEAQRDVGRVYLRSRRVLTTTSNADQRLDRGVDDQRGHAEA